ncbi:hypothetical protein DHEL01_v210163 [Diaporthe helianthi]|uniref:Uncharacterized protein n=1 Tax=Diaporthe helianthi TaxID=158607 RepID=A0A2P5HMH2_DIAHE|nr:hypothetical protein DHEL01_v210163 [Diaporthe helianthi]
MAEHLNVALDDADPQKREEAVIIENEVLKDEIAMRDATELELIRIVALTRGVQEIGVVQPVEVRKLYTAIEVAIAAFLQPMDQAIRQSKEERDRIMTALRPARSFPAFRSSIQGDPEIRAAAAHRYTNVIDVWTGYIWRLLQAMVFRKSAVDGFYGGPDNSPSAAYHMKHLDEIEEIMKKADPPVFGEYVRRLWRRQALAALFRTAKFDWLEQSRAASIEQVSRVMLASFNGFSRPIPSSQRLGLTRNIVAAAVRLSEHMMIEADDIWSIQMTGFTSGNQGSDFYTRMKEFDLKAVGTTHALRDNVPLETMSDRFNAQELRNRIRPLCTVAPALRYQRINGDGNDYDDSVFLVKPRVLVALSQAPPPAQGQQTPAAAPPEEEIFYTLARNMGLVR